MWTSYVKALLMAAIYASHVASASDASTNFRQKMPGNSLLSAEQKETKGGETDRSMATRRKTTTAIRGASVISCMTKLQRQRGF